MDGDATNPSGRWAWASKAILALYLETTVMSEHALKQRVRALLRELVYIEATKGRAAHRAAVDRLAVWTSQWAYIPIA